MQKLQKITNFEETERSYLEKMSQKSSAMDRSSRTGPMHTFNKLLKQRSPTVFDPAKAD